MLVSFALGSVVAAWLMTSLRGTVALSRCAGFARHEMAGLRSPSRRLRVRILPDGGKGWTHGVSGCRCFESGRDRLFGVGDLVNRGPHSAEALEWLEQRFDAVVLGNHDRALLRWLEGPLGAPVAGSEWSGDIPASERARWRTALGAMPLAITIPTPYGDVGVVHAEVPHPTWSGATSALEAGDPCAVDVALLGLAAPAPTIREYQGRRVGGLRALVHGHAAGRTVRRSANRWNIDSGAPAARRYCAGATMRRGASGMVRLQLVSVEESINRVGCRRGVPLGVFCDAACRRRLLRGGVGAGAIRAALLAAPSNLARAAHARVAATRHRA